MISSMQKFVMHSHWFQPEIAVNGAHVQRDKAQREKLPDYRGPLPDVLNCLADTWPGLVTDLLI